MDKHLIDIILACALVFVIFGGFWIGDFVIRRMRR